MAPLPKTRRIIKADNSGQVTATLIEDEANIVYILDDRGDSVTMTLSQWQGLITNYIREVTK